MTPPLRLAALEEPPTKLGRVIALPLAADTYSSHPGYGLTAETLVATFRAAERGQPVRQFDLFDDLREPDGHLRAVIDQRNQAVSGCDMIIRPGRDDKPSAIAAEALGERIAADTGADHDLFGLVEHQLMSTHDGIALTNLVWDLVDGLVSPVEFVHAPPRRFRSPSERRAAEVMLIVDDVGRELVPLEWGLWCQTRYRHRNPWAAGLMRTASWWAMFKRWSIRDWQVFAEMFGLPLAVGYYESTAGKATRDELIKALRQLGTDGFAALANNVEIIVKDHARSGDSSSVYAAIARLAEDQISKLIVGSTLTTDAGGPNSKGSYALGVVHESRGYTLARADARRIQTTFKRDIGAPFVRWNGFDRAAPPELKIQITRDSLERAKTLQIIGEAIDLDEDQMREEFTLRKPRGAGVRFSQPKKAVPNA